jgi:hypothetical protein
MTHSLTVIAGTNVVTPDGQRHKAGDVAAIPDRQYGTMSAAGLALFSAAYLGGTVSHQVTIAAGKVNVVLPSGRRCKGGDVAVLSDDQYSTIGAAAKAALFSADTTAIT